MYFTNLCNSNSQAENSADQFLGVIYKQLERSSLKGRPGNRLVARRGPRLPIDHPSRSRIERTLPGRDPTGEARHPRGSARVQVLEGSRERQAGRPEALHPVEDGAPASLSTRWRGWRLPGSTRVIQKE